MDMPFKCACGAETIMQNIENPDALNRQMHLWDRLHCGCANKPTGAFNPTPTGQQLYAAENQLIVEAKYLWRLQDDSARMDWVEENSQDMGNCIQIRTGEGVGSVRNRIDAAMRKGK